MCYTGTSAGARLLHQARQLLDKNQPAMAEKALQAAARHFRTNPSWSSVGTTGGSTLGTLYKELYEQVQAKLAVPSQ